MSESERLVPLEGSERKPLPGARPVGPSDPNERFEVTVYVRSRESAENLKKLADQVSAVPPAERRRVSREEFAQVYGARAEDLTAVEDYAHEHGLDVVEADPARRAVVLSGTANALSNAFGVKLQDYEYSGGKYRGREGPVQIPPHLQGIVEAVIGLDNRPQAEAHIRSRAASTGTAYTPLDVAKLYQFPTDVDGSGECIAIIELGAGYRTKDIKAYFKQLGLAPPSVTAISVDGAHNQPGGAADGEVMLDIEICGAVAPKARLAVYFAPNTDPGFIDAVSTATHDSVRNPSVISISWGNAEVNWTPQSIRAFEQVLQAATVLGVTVFAAAGDNGYTDGVPGTTAHVDYPASSPSVTGCGGTRLQSSGGTITNETVWNDAPNSATGGGVSDLFALPSWQAGVGVPKSKVDGHIGRGVPDLAGNADPATGYTIRVDGSEMVVGGTSAVAPLWAGLTALINQKLKRPVGYLNPLIYGSVAKTGSFRDITSGDNGGYSAGKGWDACTGLGSPDGSKLPDALGSGTVAKAIGR
jgi:kumamolisin